jgi:hypothetical protein
MIPMCLLSDMSLVARSYDEWKGNFYPAGLAKSKQHAYYANHFNVTSSDSTAHALFNIHFTYSMLPVYAVAGGTISRRRSH